MELPDIFELAMKVIPVCITCVTLYFTVAIHKSTNMVSMITQNRVQRYDRMCEYFINIVFCAERICFGVQVNSTDPLADLEKNVAAIKLTLHRFFDGDRLIITSAEDIVLYARGLMSQSGSHTAAEFKQKIDEFVGLCDPYLNVEWARIKKEAKGKRMKLQEWEQTFKKYRDDYSQTVCNRTST